MIQLSIQPVNFFFGTLKRKEEGSALVFQITLNCGCPTCAGGRFDPRRFKVAAGLSSQEYGTMGLPCVYSGQASQFVCSVDDVPPGRYRVDIEAMDPDSGAAGRLGMYVQIE